MPVSYNILTPPLKIFLSLIGGILLGRFFGFYPLLFLPLILFLGTKKGFFLYFFLAIAFGFYSHNLISSPSISELYYKKLEYEGVIEKVPLIDEKPSYLINLNKTFIGHQEFSLRAVLFLRSNERFNYGDRIRFEGRILPYFKEGCVGFVRNFKLIKKEKDFRFFSLKRFFLSIQNYFVKTMTYYLDGEKRGLVFGLLLGKKDYLSAKIKEAFSNAGVYHILAVSGLHLSIFAFSLFLVLSILQIRGFIRFGIIALSVFIYSGICNFSPSVVRAGIMLLLLLLAMLFDIKTMPLNNLFLAGIIILIFSPESLFKISFQLSFLATFGILYFYPKWSELIKGVKIKRYLTSSLLLSLSAFLATCGALGYYFGRIPLTVIFANLLIIPLVAIALPLSFIILLFALFLPVVAAIYAQTLNLVLELIIRLTLFFSSMPLTFKVSNLLGLIIGLSLFFFALLLTEFKLKRTSP